MTIVKITRIHISAYGHVDIKPNIDTVNDNLDGAILDFSKCETPDGAIELDAQELEEFAAALEAAQTNE